MSDFISVHSILTLNVTPGKLALSRDREVKMRKRYSHLRRVRLARELSQRELGRRAGIPQQLVCSFETGRLKPGPAIQQRLAAALEVPCDWLFSAENEK